MFLIEDTEFPETTLGPKVAISDLKTLMESQNFSKLDSIDYEAIMNKEAPLLSKDMEVIFT